MYKILIRLHKWTFDEIANLNHWQQLIAADVNMEDVGSDTMTFSNMAEYNSWKAESGL